jgi:hypothetical protein
MVRECFGEEIQDGHWLRVYLFMHGLCAEAGGWLTSCNVSFEFVGPRLASPFSLGSDDSAPRFLYVLPYLYYTFFTLQSHSASGSSDLCSRFISRTAILHSEIRGVLHRIQSHQQVIIPSHPASVESPGFFFFCVFFGCFSLASPAADHSIIICSHSLLGLTELEPTARGSFRI